MGHKLPGLALGGAPKGRHDGLGGGAVVRAGADVAEREVSIPIEDEVTTHLRHIELFRVPDLPPQEKANVAPDRAWWRDRRKTPPPETQTLIARSFGIREP